MSHDGQFRITLIAFIGSVFSPYYATARRRGAADPNNHCALNVVLHSRRGKRWAMTERGAKSLHPHATRLRIGPSCLRWDGDALVFEIDEVASPLPWPVRGQVRVTMNANFQRTFALDRDGRHRWRPLAPSARVDVRLDAPHLQWSGDGYCDSNEGDEPLEQRIKTWHWSRIDVPDGAVVFYDVLERSGAETALALKFGHDGSFGDIDAPDKIELPRSGWRIARVTRSQHHAAVAQTLDDTPFYVRSVVRSQLAGQPLTGVHETLDLDRFRSPLVQAMLPFRMHRRA